MPSDRVEEGSDVSGVPRFDFPMLDARRLGQTGRIPQDQPMAHGSGQRGSQDRARMVTASATLLIIEGPACS